MSVKTKKSGLSRRAVLKAGAALSVFPAPRLLAQSAEPLKIGFLTVLTGPLAAGGKQQEEGAALFLKERNGMIAGRKVELITQDTAGQPAPACASGADAASGDSAELMGTLIGTATIPHATGVARQAGSLGRCRNE